MLGAKVSVDYLLGELLAHYQAKLTSKETGLPAFMSYEGFDNPVNFQPGFDEAVKHFEQLPKTHKLRKKYDLELIRTAHRTLKAEPVKCIFLSK